MKRTSRTTSSDRNRYQSRKGRKSNIGSPSGCERLEVRQVLSTVTWNGQIDNNWSTLSSGHTNWVGNVLPVAGDTLVFPASPSSYTTVDDMTAGTQFNLDFQGSGYTVTGNSIALTGVGLISEQDNGGTNSIANDFTLSGDSTIEVNGYSYLTLSGNMSGGYGLTLSGNGNLTLSGTYSYYGDTSLEGLFLDVEGTISHSTIYLVGGELNGQGTVQDVVQNQTEFTSAIYPYPTGDPPLPLSTGSLNLNEATYFVPQLFTAESGSQVNVTGNVSLGDATLVVPLYYAPSTGDTFTIIKNDGIDPVVGTFIGLPEGATFEDQGTTFRVLYDGGDGNDVTLTAIGHPKVQNDSYSGPQDTPINITSPASGVLANDSDPNELTLQAVLVTGPSHGSLQLNGNGTFTYVPSPGYTGPDSFTYQATNGANLSQIATVSLVVNPSSPPPTANDDAYTVAENGSLSIDSPGVLLNDISPQSLPMTANVIVPPVHAAAFSFDPNTGAFVYVPLPGFTGVDTFTYRAYAAPVNPDTPDPDPTNSQQSNIATVTINVLPVDLAPTPIDDSFIANGDETLSVAGPGVLANDVNPNPSTPATVFLTSAPTHGSVYLSADGSFTYTPFQYYRGPDSFTYRSIVGNALSDNFGTVDITVLPVNHAPIARDDVATTPRGQSDLIDVLANDSDPDGDPLTAIIVNQPLHGTLTAEENGFLYTPNAGYVGNDFFTYRANDGQLSSEIATVNITVTPVNTAPVANDDNFAVAENNVLSVAAPGVLGNDTDAENDPLSAFLVFGPAHGSLTLNSDGSFVYTPAENYFGTDAFAYAVSDGRLSSNLATVYLNVGYEPPKPVAADYTFNTAEDNTLSINAPGLGLLSTIPGNPEGPATSFTVFNQPLHDASFTLNNDGSFSYTPAANYNGPDSFTYYITTMGVSSNLATVTLNITPVPDQPIAVGYSYATNQETPLTVAGPGLLADDINVDGDALRAALVNGPTGGNVVVNSDGSFTYTPNVGFSGTDTFTYRAINTSLASLPATVTVVVRPVNHPPIATDDLYITDRDQRVVVAAPGVLGNDGDPDPDTTLQSLLVNGPQHGQLTLNTDGSFVYTPDQSFWGTDWFTYRASDGKVASSVVTARINVNPAVPTTVNLDPGSDTGYSNTDRITKVTTPTFFGTTGPNLTVKLSVRPLGSNGPADVVGTTTADSQGNYQVTASSLADGSYQFFVTPYRADGLSYGGVLAGPLMIDTVAPRITNVQLMPGLSQIYITYQDDRSGVNSFTVASPYNYSLSKAAAIGSQAYNPSNFQVLPSVLNPLTESVVIQVASGRGLGNGVYYFAALSGGDTGIADMAGNALSGTFNGTLPSGSTTPGGDFKASFVANGAASIAPTPTSDFVPIVTPSNRVVRSNRLAWWYANHPSAMRTALTTPIGPLAHFRAHRFRRR